jgi:hypothetical protein
VQKTRHALLDSGKEVGLEINERKSSVCVFMSSHQNAEQVHMFWKGNNKSKLRLKNKSGLNVGNSCYHSGARTAQWYSAGYWLDDVTVGTGNFSFHHDIQTGSGARLPPIQWVPGALSLGMKRRRCEADHWPPSGVEVKGCVKLYLHSPNTPSWHGAQLKRKAQRQLYFLPLLPFG